MTLESFYQDVLPAEGYYCIFDAKTKAHHWAGSLAELAELTRERIDEQKIYFGTAAFSTAHRRTQANVRSLKALRLDLDAGADKHQRHPDSTYPSQRAALAALASFIRATGLTPTHIISSGEGVHVYYALQQELGPSAWLPLAQRLAASCAQHQLLVDASVTCDSARVLRPLGTPHHNGKRVAALTGRGPVWPLAELERLLPASEQDEDPLGDVPSHLQGRESVNAEAQVPVASAPSSALRIASQCAALAQVAKARGDVPEPYWYGMIGLVKHCTEGEDLIHQWSDGYEGYSQRETDRKIIQWVQGPTTCDYFAQHNPSACAQCPRRGQIKSPIVLGREAPPSREERLDGPIVAAEPSPGEAGQGSAPWAGAIPQGFTIDGGGMFGPDPTQENMPLRFCREVFWFGPTAAAEGNDDSAQVTLYLQDRGHTKTYTMEQQVLSSQAKSLEFLASRGIHVNRRKGATILMGDYLYEAIQLVKNLHRRPKVEDHLGLHVLEDGQLLAVQGRHAIHASGMINTPQLGRRLEGIARGLGAPLPESSLGEWDASHWTSHITPKARQHVQFLRTHYGKPEFAKFQLAILLTLASPLMAFVTGEFGRGTGLPKMSSLTLSLYSNETGRGKTTAVETALAAYGSPGTLLIGAQDTDTTELGRLARLPLLGTMPFLMDEMTGNAGAVARTISSVANGSGRSALRPDGTLRETGTWSLINVITTNYTQRELIQQEQTSSDAIQYRLLELNMDGIRPFTLDEITAFGQDWGAVRGQCVGALGAEIHHSICSLGMQGVARLVTTCVAHAAKVLRCSQSARFQFRALGAMLALAHLLKDKDLLPFDPTLAAKEFKRAFDEGEQFTRVNLSLNEPYVRAGRMLQDLFRHTAITDRLSRGFKADHQRGEIDMLVNERSFQGPPKARHVISTQTTYVETTAVRDWCTQQKLSYGGLVTDLIRMKVLIRPPVEARSRDGRSYRFNLSRGLEFDTGTYSTVYELDIRRLQELDPGFRIDPDERGVPA